MLVLIKNLLDIFLNSRIWIIGKLSSAEIHQGSVSLTDTNTLQEAGIDAESFFFLLHNEKWKENIWGECLCNSQETGTEKKNIVRLWKWQVIQALYFLWH